MKLVFVDQTGCLAALVAANYLLGRLSLEARRSEIIKLPSFAEPIDQDNKLRLIGLDENGNSVYTLGVGAEAALIKTSSRDLLQIFQIKEKVCLLDFSRFNKGWHILVGKWTILPGLPGLARNMAAAHLEANSRHLFLELAVQLREMGLEYSYLDLSGDDQG